MIDQCIPGKTVSMYVIEQFLQFDKYDLSTSDLSVLLI